MVRPALGRKCARLSAADNSEGNHSDRVMRSLDRTSRRFVRRRGSRPCPARRKRPTGTNGRKIQSPFPLGLLFHAATARIRRLVTFRTHRIRRGHTLPRSDIEPLRLAGAVSCSLSAQRPPHTCAAYRLDVARSFRVSFRCSLDFNIPGRFVTVPRRPRHLRST